MNDLTIASRFCGPPSSGNGGYTSGLLAARLPVTHRYPVIEAVLRQPPPLDVPLKVEYVDDGNDTEAAVLLMGGSRIAEARLVDMDLEAVDQVPPAQAKDAQAGFRGLTSHPFPSCFVCGTDRAEGDGLRIFPGPVEDTLTGDDRVAATWVPHKSLLDSTEAPDGLGRVGPSTAWAALDCVGGWAGDIGARRMVLGTMTAQIDELPVVAEPHVVVGAFRGTHGRKTFTASTLYDSDGRIVGRAQHTWIAIDPSAFG